MNFDEDGASAFQCREDNRAVGVLAFGEEGGGGVFDFGEALLIHFENGGFGGRAETVFDGADGFEPAVAIAFKIQDDIDEMFEDFRTG